MRRTFLLVVTTLVCAVTAPPAFAVATAIQAGDDEVSRLAGQATGPQSGFALKRLRELAIGSTDAAIATAATEALPAFGLDGDVAIDRVLRDGVTLAARARALELCVARRRPEDRGLFLELAAGEVPTQLRMQAIDALASDREALPFLEPLLDAADPRVQARVLRVLGRARMPAAFDRARQILSLEARYGIPLRIAAIEVLRDDGRPESIRKLVAVAGQELGEVRDFAFKSLLVMDRGAVLLLLLPMIAPTAPSSDALVALDVLPRVDGGSVPEVRQAVRGALDHPDAAVQVAALHAAATIGDREALPRIERASASFDPMVAAAAIEAMAALRRDDPGLRERLQRLLRAPKPQIRLAAVRSLAALADPSATALLVDLLKDDDWRVREAAAVGLGRMRAPTAIGPLIDALDGERMRVRGAIVHALRRTTGMSFHDTPRTWRRWWSDVQATFKVPSLEQIDAMESRLARSSESSTRATFYGLPVDSDHLALVIDVSGSMAEHDPATGDGTTVEPTARVAPSSKLDVAKREVELLLERLPDGTSMNLFFFSTDVQRWQHGLVPVSRSYTARACAFVRERRASGATNLFDALADAIADPQIDTIYLLSDGNPTAGRIVEPVALRTEIARRNAARNVRIHVVALGCDSPLLHHLAEDSGGTYLQR